MAEEDLIFGKNRHFFGGIEPSNMRVFTARMDTTDGSAKVKIDAKLPFDTIVNSQTLCTVKGATIRRKSDGYPVDEFDGVEIANISESAIIYDSEGISESGSYYYSAFPYTTQGVYNRSTLNRSSTVDRLYEYLFGFDMNTEDRNPNIRVIYPADVDNHSYAPAKMDFSNDTFIYGDWPSTPGVAFMPKPCMLTYAGTVNQYLNPNDYTKTTEGLESMVGYSTFGGNAMMEWPKIFTKRWTDADGTYHFRCCDVALDNDYECWCNYDQNNRKIDHFYTSIYFGSSVSGKMRSISGQANSVSTTADAEIALAKANGNSWHTEVLADRLLIQDLLIMMGKTTDCQENFGFGVCNGGPIGQGTMNNKGMFWGGNDKVSGVKVFGMENWWGNLFRRTAGWVLSNGTQLVKLTRGTRDGSSTSDYNTNGSGYKSVSGGTPSGSNGGYISAMKNEAFGRIPVIASGSSSTYEADGMYFANSGVYYAIVGGWYGVGLLVGPFCVYLSAAASVAGANYGAALSCKPLA